MSSAYFSEAPTSTRLDASCIPVAHQSFAPIDKAQDMVYPSMYPWPGASHLPSVSEFPNIPLPAFSPLVPDAHNAGGVYYDPNVQGHNTIAPLLPSVDDGQHQQPAPFTFQYSLPTQSEAAFHPGPVQNLQYHWQVAQDHLTVTEPPREPERVHREDYRTDEESHAGLVAPKCLNNDLCNSQTHPPEDNTTIHTCLNDANSACTGRGHTCLETVLAFMAKYPSMLSSEQFVDYLVHATNPLRPDTGQSAGQSSPANSTDDPPSQLRQMDWGTPSIDSNTTTSALSSMGGLTAKRRRSENEDSECTNSRGDCQPFNNDIPNDTQKRRKKKKKACDEGEFICRICVVLKRPPRQLSRKDALKRHIATVHALFIALFGHEALGILKPRQRQDEDLQPLIMSCINLQRQARERGEEIRPTHDLALLHPDVVALMLHDS